MGVPDYVPLYKNEQGYSGGFGPTLTKIIKGHMQLNIGWAVRSYPFHISFVFMLVSLFWVLVPGHQVAIRLPQVSL